MLAEPVEHITHNRVRFQGRELRYFAGGDYHGFAHDPDMLALSCDNIKQHGLHISSSRSSTGNAPVYAAFESSMAEYFQAPAASLCSSGFVANLALVEALVDDFEHFVIDEGCHASSQYALRWTGKPISRFAHNDVAALNSVLTDNPNMTTLVISDTVGGMRGDLAPVAELLETTQTAGATLVLDDSHSLGVLGDTGRGAVEAFGIDPQWIANEQIIRTSSLNKALGAHGGLVLGSKTLQTKVQSATAFYTASPVPLAPLAVARAATERLANGRLCKILKNRATRIKRVLRDLGWDVQNNDLPVVSLRIRDDSRRQQARDALLAHDIYPSFVAYPGLPGRQVLKLTLFSAHSDDDIEALLTALPAL